MSVTAALRAVREIESYNDNARRRGTVSSSTDIPKNTLLKLADGNLFSASTGTGDVVAGVSDQDKDDDDPSTSIGVYPPGIFEFTASGSITAGRKVKTAAPGQYVMAVTDADVTSSLSIIVGTAVNSKSDGERVQVRMNLE